MFLEIDQKEKEQMALIDHNGEILSYGQLKAFIDETAGLFPERCLIFILCKNCTGAAAAYLSALSNHIVPLLLGASIDRELLKQLEDRYQPSFLWKPSCDVCDGDRVVFEAFSYSLVSCGRKPCEMYGQLSLLLPTSGSTGSPKLVRHSYTNLESNARNIAEFFQLDGSQRPMLDLPMQYTYGLSVLNSHIYAGATVLLSDLSMMQQEYWNFFKDNQATSITGVPYTYEMLKRFRIFRMKLPSLQLLSQGGGKLSEELHREYAEFAKETNRKFIVTYGQTEGSARMAYLPAEKALDKPGSIGKAIPGGTIYLVDEAGQRIQGHGNCDEITGEIVYEGPNVTLGYAESIEDLTRGDERKGVLYTGDIARQDAEGYLYIIGRKKRFLKLYGNRISLDECEQMLQREFAAECACTGLDNQMKIYMTGHVESESVIRFLSRKIQIHEKAFEVFPVEELPRNEAGKILYDSLGGKE